MEAIIVLSITVVVVIIGMMAAILLHLLLTYNYTKHSSINYIRKLFSKL